MESRCTRHLSACVGCGAESGSATAAASSVSKEMGFEGSARCRREFFYLIGSSTDNFDKMEGNAICKQIDWDDDDEFYKAWDEARTGFPWIDAIMTQLHEQVLCAQLPP